MNVVMHVLMLMLTIIYFMMGYAVMKRLNVSDVGEAFVILIIFWPILLACALARKIFSNVQNQILKNFLIVLVGLMSFLVLAMYINVIVAKWK